MVAYNLAGVTVDVPQPYEAGHECTEAEAKALNQTLLENLRNNFYAKMKKAKETGQESVDALVAKFNEYANSYRFSGKRQTRAPVDPVLREAHKIAMAKLKEALAEKGVKFNTVKNADELAEALVAKYPAIMEEAKRRIDAQKSVAIASLEGLGL